MKLILPKLHLVVLSDLKADENDSRKYIHVVNKHAIVQNGLCVIVNLREYIKRECEIEEDDDFQMMDAILDWMEGKSFDSKFWSELTKKNFVTLHRDGLKIENPNYNKILEYEDVPREIENMIKSITTGLIRNAVTVDRIAVTGINFEKLTNIFKSEMKQDCFLFDFCGKENSVKFQAQRQSHIFGLLPVDYNAATEFTSFIEVTDFGKYLDANAGEIV